MNLDINPIVLFYNRTEIVGDTIFIFLGFGEDAKELTLTEIYEIDRRYYPTRMPRNKVSLVYDPELYEREDVCKWARAFNQAAAKMAFVKQIDEVHHSMIPYRRAMQALWN